MENAARSLAKSVTTHLSANERAQVTSRNLTSLSAAESGKAQTAFERALQKNVRNPAIIDVAFTVSENVQGYLLVAEIMRGSEKTVEMISFRREAAIAPTPRTVILMKKLVWEQTEPILDIAMPGNKMLVLGTDGVAEYEQHEGKWERMESVAIAAAPARDPRGRMEIVEDALIVNLPGLICKGAWKPLSLQCEAGGMFTAGRNTLESADWPPHFASASLGGATLLAETDGRMHVYDSSHKPVGTFDGWGSDFTVMQGTCAANRIATTGTAGRDSADLIALYELVNNAPVGASDPVQLPGPVTALWPSRDGAFAVVRNLSSGRYEAYGITADCGR